jgi:hypothetical protein
LKELNFLERRPIHQLVINLVTKIEDKQNEFDRACFDR